MIIGDRRAEVVENIRKAANERNLNAKVEVNDPKLTTEQSAALVERYIKRRDKVSFKAKSYCSRKIVNTFTKALNKETEIIGIENMDGIKGGAIITCNHFNPVDNTAVRTLVRRLGKKRINIVSQETNLAMTGMVGFLMNYSVSVKPWNVTELHNTLNIYEYDSLLVEYRKVKAKYLAQENKA